MERTQTLYKQWKIEEEGWRLTKITVDLKDKTVTEEWSGPSRSCRIDDDGPSNIAVVPPGGPQDVRGAARPEVAVDRAFNRRWMENMVLPTTSELMPC